MTEIDLGTVDTDAMIEELRKRFDCFILLAEFDNKKDDVAWRQHWDGSMSRIIGMLARAQHRFLRDCDEQGEQEA